MPTNFEFAERGNNSKNLSLPVRLDSSDVDSFKDIFIKLQFNSSIHMDLVDWIGTFTSGVQLVGFENQHVSLLSSLIVKVNALGIGSQKGFVNQCLSSLTKQFKIHNEWDV